MKKILILPLLFFAASVYADTRTTNLKSTAVINKSCQLSASNISFAAYVPGQGDRFASGNLSVICTNGTSVTIGLSPNSGGPASDKFAVREGASSYAAYITYNTNKLVYNLFQDAAHTLVFGGPNWFLGTANSRPTLIANGQMQNVPVYAAMSGSQFVAPGSYSDTVQAYITF